MTEKTTRAIAEGEPDQALVAATTCTRCICVRPPPLEKRGRFWLCSACGASYGEHAHG